MGRKYLQIYVPNKFCRVIFSEFSTNFVCVEKNRVIGSFRMFILKKSILVDFEFSFFFKMHNYWSSFK